MEKKLLLTLFSVFTLGTYCQAQIINTIAGNGNPAYSGDNAASVFAEVNTPYGVAVDLPGNIYIADYGNHRIRKIDRSTGTITTIAGTGAGGFTGDGSPATAAQIKNPRAIAVDNLGNVYFSDYGNNRIRKIDHTTTVITTIAGNFDGLPAYYNDGGLADTSHVGFPWGLTVDNATGDVYFADQLNNRVRKIDAAGIISTVGGNGISAFGGDGGPALAAKIQYPTGVAFDNAGNLYVADNGNNRIRKINTSGIISTITGSATYGFTGDGGPAVNARVYYPQAVTVDQAGNIYICDLNNNRIRKINAAGIISTITGNGNPAFSGDGGPLANAEINQPSGIAVDTAGNIYIADRDNNRIRYTSFAIHAPAFTRGDSSALTVCAGENVIDSLMSVFDLDLGQTETWSLLTPPANGTAATVNVTISTGAVMTTTNLKYTSNAGFYGRDSFQVMVTDGTYYDTTMVHVIVVAPPTPTTITGGDSVCVGHTLMLSDSPAGGTWSSFNTTVATVDATTGIVTGVLPSNHDTIYYTVTNMCGTGMAQLTVFTRSASRCATGIETTGNTPNGVILYPNPNNNGAMTLNLASDIDEPVRFVITTVTGRIVKEIDASTNTSLDVRISEPAGIYLVSATTAHGKWVEKLTIMK